MIRRDAFGYLADYIHANKKKPDGTAPSQVKAAKVVLDSLINVTALEDVLLELFAPVQKEVKQKKQKEETNG